MVSIPSRGTKIPQSAWHGLNKFKKLKKKNTGDNPSWIGGQIATQVDGLGLGDEVSGLSDSVHFSVCSNS